MPTSHPMRLDPELTASARSNAKRMSRSLSQQVAHWAHIGRELERSPGVTVSAVQAVLEGRGDYDRLNLQEQAIVRANWAERIEATRKNLRLDRVLAAKGGKSSNWTTMDGSSFASRKARAPGKRRAECRCFTCSRV